jgi:hypothetical protein
VGQVPSGASTHEVDYSAEKVTFLEAQSVIVIMEYNMALVSMGGYSERLCGSLRCILNRALWEEHLRMFQHKLQDFRMNVLITSCNYCHRLLIEHREMLQRHEVDNRPDHGFTSVETWFQVRQNVFECFVA